MVASTLGKPSGPALRSNPSTVSRRPLTLMVLPLSAVSSSIECRNFCMLKNEPWKSNVNGIVGKPAAPTVAPGGSALAMALADGVAELAPLAAAATAVAGLAVGLA